jgi:hypothetical protein
MPIHAIGCSSPLRTIQLASALDVMLKGQQKKVKHECLEIRWHPR